MENVTLNVLPRNVLGKGAARKMRAKGNIPAICYGKYNPPVLLSVDPLTLRKILNTPLKRNTAITMKVDGTDISRLVMVKDIQLDPVSHRPLHADFLEINENEQIMVHVPIALTGKSKGVAEGGILQQVTRTVLVKSLPLKIPASIDIDVSDLAIGQSVHIKDVKFAEGVEAKYDSNFTIAVVVVPTEEAAPVVAAVEGAAEAPAAEGAAAPAGEPAKDGKAAPAPAKDAKTASPEKHDKKDKG